MTTGMNTSLSEAFERMPVNRWLGGETLARSMHLMKSRRPWQLDALADSGLIERRETDRGHIQYRKASA